MRVRSSPGRHENVQRLRTLGRRAQAVEGNRQWSIEDVDQALKRLGKVVCRGRDRLFYANKDNAVSFHHLGFGGVVPIERLVLDQLCNRDLLQPIRVGPSGGASLQGEGRGLREVLKARLILVFVPA